MVGICGPASLESLSLWVQLPGELTRLGPSECARDIIVAPAMAVIFVLIGGWRYWKLVRTRAKRMRWTESCVLGIGGPMNSLQTLLLTIHLCAGISKHLTRPPGAREAAAIVSLFVSNAGALVVTTAELLHDADRGWELKCFWLCDALISLNSMRIRLLQWALIGPSEATTHRLLPCC